MNQPAPAPLGSALSSSSVDEWPTSASTSSAVAPTDELLDAPRFLRSREFQAVVHVVPAQSYDTVGQRSLLIYPVRSFSSLPPSELAAGFGPFLADVIDAEQLRAAITSTIIQSNATVGVFPEPPEDRGVSVLGYKRKVLASIQVTFRTRDLPRWTPTIVLGLQDSTPDED